MPAEVIWMDFLTFQEVKEIHLSDCAGDNSIAVQVDSGSCSSWLPIKMVLTRYKFNRGNLLSISLHGICFIQFCECLGYLDSSLSVISSWDTRAKAYARIVVSALL